MLYEHRHIDHRQTNNPTRLGTIKMTRGTSQNCCPMDRRTCTNCCSCCSTSKWVFFICSCRSSSSWCFGKTLYQKRIKFVPGALVAVIVSGDHQRNLIRTGRYWLFKTNTWFRSGWQKRRRVLSAFSPCRIPQWILNSSAIRVRRDHLP